MSDSSAEIIGRWTGSVPGTVADRTGDNQIAELGHRRMGLLLDALGNPQLDYKTIHIAGSKGKGTTAYYAATLLRTAGERTGLYTSPHLIRWNERIAVDGAEIDETTFRHVLLQVESAMKAMLDHSAELVKFNAFELLTAAAFLHFRNEGCAIAVVEVGIGGRFDSTNHLQPSATVITRIESEHADILGPDIETIAWNKAGIIRPGIPVILRTQIPPVRDVIAHEARQISSPLLEENVFWKIRHLHSRAELEFGNDDKTLALPKLAGVHNYSNFGAAMLASSVAAPESTPSFEHASDALQSNFLPGRFDRRVHPTNRRTLILDVAHTSESLESLIRTAREEFATDRFEMVLGVLADKPIRSLLNAVSDAAIRLRLPRLNNPRGLDPREIAREAAGMGLEFDLYPNVTDALKALDPENGPTLITGSFGIVAETLDFLESAARGAE